MLQETSSGFRGRALLGARGRLTRVRPLSTDQMTEVRSENEFRPRNERRT